MVVGVELVAVQRRPAGVGLVAGHHELGCAARDDLVLDLARARADARWPRQRSMKIRLCVDREDAPRGRVRDPFTQRLRHELAPGIWVRGALSGGTLILDNYSFGCTRDAGLRPAAKAVQ